MVLEFAGAEQQDAALNGRHPIPGTIDVRRDDIAQGADVGKCFREQRFVEPGVGLVETGDRFGLDANRRLVLAADQVLVEALDDEFAGAMSWRLAHG